MSKYLSQNTHYKDYLKFAALLYRRYRARGHQPSTLRKYFLSAHTKLSSSATLEKPLILTSTGNQRQSFLHCQYNATDPPGRALMQLHTKHCQAFQEELHLLPPKICYSRPKKLVILPRRQVYIKIKQNQLHISWGSFKKDWILE